MTLIDSMLIPEEYVARKPVTATEIRFRLGEFERSPATEELNRHFQDWIDEVTEKLVTTPIQFRFPRSKKKRIRKKWGKDPRNFRRLLDDQFEDIQIVRRGG